MSALSRVGTPTGSGDEQTQWMPVSDLMAGLMMVFLLLSVSMMRYALIERDRIKDIAVAYQDTQLAIHEALRDEFADDLSRWGATIDRDTLTIDFHSPDVLFRNGSAVIGGQYKAILTDFFPRYIEQLLRFRDSIGEVRIEGHTNSLWRGRTTPAESYFGNMELSQDRTRSVLEYVYGLDAIGRERSWIKQHVAAVGFSSSKLLRRPDGREDIEGSKRVSFRVITNADLEIRKILEG